MPEILVTELIKGPAMERLGDEFQVACYPDIWRDPVGLKELMQDVRAVIVRNQTELTRELIESAKRLEVIGRAGTGLDNIDTVAAEQLGVTVCNTPAENSLAVAELVMGLMLTMARELPAAISATRAGGWGRQKFTGVELHGKTLGLVGFGRIGQLVARRAVAFGMKIVVHDDYLPQNASVLQELDVSQLGFHELLQVADVVSCHVPLTVETRGMFNAAAFAKMRQGSWFINAARGEIVGEEALLASLVAEHVGAAALDVREVEPPVDVQSTGLASLENVYLTPHIGAFTVESQTRVLERVCKDVGDVLTRY
ncbi:MAG: hydroxyacid dehydrogenase [Planctomycetaceae bacterium]|jgi:D-3-phosphoglycerate dehydrogenase / 2-oxoglutarate reductase|nr:hydroxyacid dehydrogenase [Planctomycetaceae bacterium]